ncbi:ABC transporter substrate-binding protein [Sphingoaurantiacus capsulatus]|uniref:ABC transporter substrate-binding protein n=1 Tax=Sphingoaurantiacus capsulatus TaxID=1771310 RepID=A0ABV7X9W2_9SPHN
MSNAPALSRAVLSRRGLLQRAASAGAVAGLALTVGCGAKDDRKTLRWWSPQASPEQLKAYRAQIAAFEAKNAGIRVVFEPTSDEGYPAQFAAAFAAKQLPNIVTHLPSFTAQSYYARGLLEPVDDVIQAIGPANYFDGANDVYRTADGHFCGTGIGNTAVDMLWYRKDLLQAAGIGTPPTTWDELRDACRRVQRPGVYGAPLPYGMNAMTSLIFIGFIHRAGGQVFAPDLSVAIDGAPTYDALEFFKSMREFCPPGASNFSWGESLTAFVSGATATGIYGGRVLANVAAQNPKIADQIGCATYPTASRAIPAWTFNDFPSLIIPKGASHLAETKAFAASLYDPQGYIPQLHAAPGHVLPVLKPIAENPVYRANPLISKYAPAIDLMTRAAAAGHNLGRETTAHQPNLKASEIVASNTLAELVQRVVLNKENPRAAVAATATKLQALMRG